MPKPKKICDHGDACAQRFRYRAKSEERGHRRHARAYESRLNERELEAVLGHELAHVKNRDVMVLTWASIIVIAAGFLLQMLFWLSLFGGFGGGMGGDRRDAGQLMIVMLAVYVGTIIIYFVSQMLIMTLSRYREFAADRGGAVITGAPLQLASALQKISNDMYRIPGEGPAAGGARERVLHHTGA